MIDALVGDRPNLDDCTITRVQDEIIIEVPTEVKSLVESDNDR